MLETMTNNIWLRAVRSCRASKFG
ncbi:hypothetical protein PCC21_013070 [Pectobacterium carotovorum subsp. carotovorum PCC21]|nr:hypothetical protein PCC21_013070 [Pectobacterium carotovorum subsp. carotovorum PCC21]